MPTDPRAGEPADPAILVDVDGLLSAYAGERPDAGVPAERVAFGTSGHRGSSLRRSFNEAHILAITQAICEQRVGAGVDGPLFLGADSHALSAPALDTALEVLAANGVAVIVQSGGGFTPTPVVSHAILTHNAGAGGRADGIVVSPSHNPPEDGGFKYNPPHGGPAGSDVTGWIQDRANALLASGLREVRRMPLEAARSGGAVRARDLREAYVGDLPSVVDLDAIRSSGLRIGADALGGASMAYWPAIAERHGLDITVLDGVADPTFSFMTVDWDGRIRMDCSSPYAMRRLIGAASSYDLAVANDTDADRHGVVTPRGGLLDPNHYLAVAASQVVPLRAGWPRTAAIGKTVVTSSLLDRVAADLGRPLVEVPVGFKWFVGMLLDGSAGFAGEESAGASLLRRDGSPWTTDKDGIVLALLAAEITARTGRDLADLHAELTDRLGPSWYRRVDAPAGAAEKQRLSRLDRSSVAASALAGDPITDVLTAAPGNGAPIGGVKVVTARGWFAARPSGTEDVVKIYAESLVSEEHLDRILGEAAHVVDTALSSVATGSAG